MASTVTAILILLSVAISLAAAYRSNYGGYNNYNYGGYGNNGYGNYNYYNSYNPYRNYNNNGYGYYNNYNNYNGYSNYNYSPFQNGGTTAGGTYVGSPLARIWLTCNGIGCPARG
uniref:Uncharacterized protein n=1 Tax=Steinernema glaseri TaxID=37863 RepID=A0A1I7YKX1_9BILA